MVREPPCMSIVDLYVFVALDAPPPLNPPLIGELDSCFVLFSQVAMDCFSGLEHKSVVVHY